MTSHASTRPLDGRRVVITRPRGRSLELRRELLALGARVIPFPLIEIHETPRLRALEAELRTLDSYDWIAFTSAHGVDAVMRGLAAIGRGAGSLSSRVAAVGPGTAAALERYGIRAELVARPATAEGLAAALREAIQGPACILHPTSDRACRTLSSTLSSGGHLVTEVVAYRTLAAKPPSPAVRRRAARADAILVCSPSAVQQLHARRVLPPRAVLACIGPVTARAAHRLGLRVGAVAQEPTPRALATAVAHALVRAR